MKKLTFKVNPKAEFSIFGLIKEVNQLHCRIYIGLENGTVEVENVDEQQLETVIDLIANNFNLLTVNIDNTSDDTVSLPTPVKAESFAEQPKEVVTEETVEEPKKPTVLEPESEDDLIIKKVSFENEYVEEALNKLAKTAYWAMYKANVSENDVGKYFLSCKSEITMAYNPNDIIDFAVGDVIDCNFGMHLMGEAQGAHILAIVCNIAHGNMACVVPLAKKVYPKRSPLSYMPVSLSNDVTIYFEGYSDNFAILDKAKYVRVERFRKVMGHVKPDFFKALLKKLATNFDFTGSAKTEDTETDSTENESVKVEKPVKSNSTAKKISTEETALLKVIGPALGNINSTVSPTIQLLPFLDEIGFDTSSDVVTNAFIAACNVKKINYENIILEIHNSLTELPEDEIKNEMKSIFKVWLEKHPEIAEKCPKISIMALLKVYAKKFA